MTRVAFVGPMLGRHPGLVPNPAEELAPLLTASGIDCRLVSQAPHPLLRAMDTVQTLIRWGPALDFAVIVTYSGHAFRQAQAAGAVLRARGVPYAFYLKGGALPEFTAKHRGLVAGVLRRGSPVLAPSPYLQRMADELGCRTELVPNVFNLDRTVFRHRTQIRPRLLWMRTFHEIYDPTLAIDALVELRKSGVDAHLTMAGSDKGTLGATRDLIAEKDLGGVVSLVGFVGDEQKPRLFDSHDIFLHTSRVDNTPVSVHEAMAFGLPVVGTNVGGMRDFVSDAATLVPLGDSKGMATATAGLLADSNLASAFSVAGRRLVEAHGWSEIGPRWLRLIEENRRHG